jgi:MFS family permease
MLSADNGLAPTSADAKPWWHGLTRYHWFVFTVAALGWMADCMDQQLFNVARKAAVTELIDAKPGDIRIDDYATYATSMFLMGWAIGGIFFGIMGDRIGRVKTMMLTILVYALFTGLNAFSISFWDFALFRFLSGLGVGGEFAVGVALLAEVMPDRARPFTLGLLQGLSAIGNITAAAIYMALGHWEGLGVFDNLRIFGYGPIPAWRFAFVVGLAPALLALLIRRRLREPERWKAVASSEIKRKLGSYAELFGDPRWRRRALVGLGLAFSGVVGLWGIGFFSIDLQQNIFQVSLSAEGLSGRELNGEVKFWAGVTSITFNVGAALGIFAFSGLTHYTGRKPAFAVSFVIALVSTAAVFWSLQTRGDIFWMIPLMGFCQLSLFGGYAIYFPELFPTRLRSTGTSFCYNVGRFVSAVGPLALGQLTRAYADTATSDPNMPRRLAGITMCAVFLIGLLVLPFAPETKGQPLPE